MARSIEALVKPALLEWARTTAGLDAAAAARRVGISEDRLRAWESGREVPSVAQLAKAANVYKRPLAVFYLPAPPEEPPRPRDFRRLDESDPLRAFSSALRLAIRRARYQRSVALKLGSHPDLAARIHLHDDYNRASSVVRDTLKNPGAQRNEWGNPYAALSAWRTAAEDAGVLVFQASGVAVAEMRGFSLGDRPLPVIVLNAADSPRAKSFSLLHEFTHVLLGATGVCDLHEDARGEDAEVFCNRIAGEVLVPEAALRAQIAERGFRGAWVSQDALQTLANHFWASPEVIARRLLILNEIDDEEYRHWRRELMDRPHARRAQGRGPSVDRKTVANLGKRYVRLVFEAFHSDEISLSDASTFLGVRVKHFPRIERIVYGGPAEGEAG
jgi:Zn-dependent peptidase ImmA (M78 family)